MRTRSSNMQKGLIFGIFAFFIVAAILIGIFFFNKSSKLYSIVTVEAGTEKVDVSQFIKGKNIQGSFITDLNTINMKVPGTYEIQIQIGKKVYSSKLEVKDTVAPTAEIVNQEAWAKEEKEAAVFVNNIVDVTDVKVSYKQQPDFNKIGEQDVLILLEDSSGNKTELKAVLTIIGDTEPPKITGARDQIIYIGDTVAYKKDVTVTDNRDKDVKLVVDSSAVDLKKAGSYKVTYTAADNSGNITTVTVTFKVAEKPKAIINIDDLDALADKVLANIITDSMSKEEKAKKIYEWTRASISYVDYSDKSDWKKAAVQGFKKGSGDCFIYFATAQALLNRAGIENQGIIKIDGHHYWSLIKINNVWRHFDATPRKGDTKPFSLFMLTDAQIEAYSKAHKNSHVWDKTKYPAAQ